MSDPAVGYLPTGEYPTYRSLYYAKSDGGCSVMTEFQFQTRKWALISELVCLYYDAGKSLESLTETMGISRETVYEILVEHKKIEKNHPATVIEKNVQLLLKKIFEGGEKNE